MSVVKASRLLAVPCPPLKSKSLSLQLLVSNSFIQHSGTGLFSLLPLGQRVISRLTAIIERELDAIGAQKVAMPFLGAKELWEKTGRWDSMGSELLKVTDRKKKEFCIQPTAEEMMTDLVGSHSKPTQAAYPLLIYQTSEKFRDEMNPRFGLIRGRSFLMNDLYSFDLSEERARETYGEVIAAYDRILKERLGLEVFKVRADSGVHGGSLSHEYHMRNGLEEDAMEVCGSCHTYHKAGEASEPCCEAAPKRRKVSSIEVAHTFILGTRYAEALNGFHGFGTEKRHYHMCCFGIGVTRLFAAIVEARTTVREPRIHLPTVIQPFDAVVVPSKSLLSSPLVGSMVESLQEKLRTRENPAPSVLIDDREFSIGRRLQYAMNIGQSRVVVMGKETERTEQMNAQFELWTGNPAESEKLQNRGNFDLAATVEELARY